MGDSPTLALACRLISRRSVTPEDAGCMDILSSRLSACGFSIERMDRGGVANLWARRGHAAPLVCLAGHTDVVPAGDPAEWKSDPFVPSIRDGLLVGRGAADMKSSLAAFVTAIERFTSDCPDHSGSIALLLTSDEEGDAIDGTARVVEALRGRGEPIDFCIVGEPTSVEKLGDTIKNGRRGSLSARLVVRGTQGHVAYPHLARNPIHLAAPALAELCATAWDDGGAYFPPTTFQISNIHGGSGATNVIPGQLEALFNFRFSSASSPESLKSRTAAILDAHGLEYTLAWSVSAKPYLTPRGSLVDAVTASIRAVLDIEPVLSTTGGTSDGRFIAEICPQVVELGPSNATIHKVRERIAIADLEALSAVYEDIMRRLIGQTASIRGGGE
jgi:succinyl-diaminopimelate desuccinylase